MPLPAVDTNRPRELIRHDLTAEHPNQPWVADPTDVRTGFGWVHAAFVLHVCSRLIVGRQVSHLKRNWRSMLMPEPVVRVPVDQLRQVFELLIDHVARNSGTGLTVSRDYFWSIPASERYDVYAVPGEFTIGRVSESLANLQGMLEDESKALGYGLVWLADVLRAIGDEAVG
ncbi:hypothetical protein ACFO1B_42635 [Dactylosporangium siamense]|uniref:Uncharacterized protein n=1 Tax=Dactylosporangium siamense TaxID=685454 RepID=A0A919PWT2_9ACTN|nr:hypothetical protein [Dactylosporangium siamense]GIG51122.1 hypothetical protein Dsi01nite_091630 [Dactylosporangium siamense]